MGEAAYILGVKIHWDRSKQILELLQEAYIRKVIERFSMSKKKFIEIPIAKNHSLSLKDCPTTPGNKARLNAILYVREVRNLLCTIVYTQPILAFALGLLS